MRKYKNTNNYIYKVKLPSGNEYLIKDCAKKICETITEVINSNFKSTIKKYSDNSFYNIIKNNYSIAWIKLY